MVMNKVLLYQNAQRMVFDSASTPDECIEKADVDKAINKFLK